ncbi:hypothetical protein K2173_019038 [Erythroxylum novogranatense]|uniref:Prephenate/arogenate dehydrogenase domain-containing protein n=1 Tax=Erythroxylum novogranatense TaxID=1862640 RepID=A0AAV8ST69_9ROSI|nr:hypothetical protein K2173_019038 [Erythroxylum novogranatense]
MSMNASRVVFKSPQNLNTATTPHLNSPTKMPPLAATKPPPSSSSAVAIHLRPSFNRSISSSFITLKPSQSPSHSQPQRSLRLRIAAIDAAQPYDYEARLRLQHLKSQSLKIAIIGFGNFGQFLAKTFSRQGHTVLAYSRTNYADVAKSLGVTFYTNPDDLCENHPEVVVLCTSILSTEKVLMSFPFQRLKRSTLFVDVLSVKEYAKTVLLKHLPVEFDVLCTHPMFGPESGKDSWTGLPFVYDKVRIGNEDDRIDRCEKFLEIFAGEGCRMVPMSCVEHDRYAAGSQFITHTMGRVLEKFGLESSPINTKGYETLLNLVENTKGDSFELYYGLFLFNNNALEQLERLDMAFEAIKKELFSNLHKYYRKQLFGNTDEVEVLDGGKQKLQRLLTNGAPSDAHSDIVN